MADMGMNIVTVIHQPRYSVFSLFHEVLLLGKAGRTVFQVRTVSQPNSHLPDCHSAQSMCLSFKSECTSLNDMGMLYPH